MGRKAKPFVWDLWSCTLDKLDLQAAKKNKWMLGYEEFPQKSFKNVFTQLLLKLATLILLLFYHCRNDRNNQD